MRDLSKRPTVPATLVLLVLLGVLACWSLGSAGASASVQRSPELRVARDTGVWRGTITAVSRAGRLRRGRMVAVSCRLKGAAVSGDRWWYRVTSRPWDDRAYVPAADVAGRAGRARVDTSVVICARQGAAAVVDLAVRASATTSDYLDPDRGAGPGLRLGGRVSLVCWVSGAMVHGDAFWYLIASPPWNATYYVSAYAFRSSPAGSAPPPYLLPALPPCPSAKSAPVAPAPVLTSTTATSAVTSSTTTPTGTTTTTTSAVTFVETVGGVTHTWSDYADAGGSEGPTIASNQSVQVDCWVSGFRVADGDTYWYRIASAPWSGAFYASADAFYNNGATTGSLIGTPFVDPAVPECGGSPSVGGGGGGPATYLETAGGLTHTWSDYGDAGGTAGQAIAPYQGVQVACWVSGFRVADGNTYWYRIASSPWDDSFYASADAFYNNGATSGSLLGTPFVDPNVPECT